MASLPTMPRALSQFGLLALAFDRQLVVAFDKDLQVGQLKLGKFRFDVQVVVVLPEVERRIDAVGKPPRGRSSQNGLTYAPFPAAAGSSPATPCPKAAIGFLTCLCTFLRKDRSSAPPRPPRTKKADAAKHPKVLNHVGLLFNEPPGSAGLPFV